MLHKLLPTITAARCTRLYRSWPLYLGLRRRCLAADISASAFDDYTRLDFDRYFAFRRCLRATINLFD